MIRERVFNLSNNTETTHYYDNMGNPANESDFELARRTTAFICPECGAPTFGRFEPFVERGIQAWCSTCGHIVGDKRTQELWLKQHPEVLAE